MFSNLIYESLLNNTRLIKLENVKYYSPFLILIRTISVTFIRKKKFKYMLKANAALQGKIKIEQRTIKYIMSIY